MSHLNEKDLQNLKEQLEKEAGELEVQLNQASKNPDFGSDTETDFSEEADEAEELSKNLGMQDVLKSRMQDIETALDKMTRGQYGKCEKCGKEIPVERLEANPAAEFCITHAS